MALVPLAEAVAHVLERVHPLGAVTVPLVEAAGLVLAEPVTATTAVPPFDNTAMDGFAVRADDTAGASEAAPVRLAVVGTAAAGPRQDLSVGRGEAVRIMTGAPVPAGADAIVMVERTRTAAGSTESGVDVLVPATPGDHIRRAGEDTRVGQVVAAPGDVLGPARIGVLANVGCASVSVHRRPVVGVISTGDELVAHDAVGPLPDGCIRDSNRPMLLATVAAEGFDAVDLGHVADDEEALRTALGEAATTVDAVVTSGGVSVGDFDLVKAILDELGDMRWMQIAIKPAKPFAFGVLGAVPVFGLPGNPVSSAVSFELLARPALRAMAGHRDLVRRRVQAIVAEPLLRRADGKTHFVRVVVRSLDDGGWTVRPAGGQGSHQLSALADATALAVLVDGDGAQPGDVVEVIPLTGDAPLRQ